MHDVDDTIAALGNEPPLIADGRSGPPDRREISARWLSGTFLTGLTSTVLMGVALVAALDGREMLATPPEIAKLAEMDGADSGEAAKTGRLDILRPLVKAKDRRRMEVSTVTQVGDREVIRTLPFVQVRMALAANHTTSRDYPEFDPLVVFAEDEAVQTANTGLIYGAKVESEVLVRTVDFPVQTAKFEERSDLSADEVEEVVRITGAILTDGDVQVAALHYVDPQRFGGAALTPDAILASYGVRIVPENVSVSPREIHPEPQGEFAEEIVAVQVDQKIADVFTNAGYAGDDAVAMADALATIMKTDEIKAGWVVRIGVEVTGEEAKVVRASLYEGSDHAQTVALDDRGQFIPGEEPEPHPEIATAFDTSTPPVRVRGDLPSVYDGIFRAAYSYGLTRSMTQQLVKLLASEVDFQSRLDPTDRLEVFFSSPDEDDKATVDSELLYVSAHFGDSTRNFYRFRLEDGTVDYFDSEGKSARQFLLRNPLPNGQFRSGFGMRRHPILGYSRMHTGVDWSAPRGTPIIAAGNGVVQKAGWTGGYGRQTIIKHTNGYVTSYSHQSGIAKGIAEGVKVRQGQVIGYVGATGMATGDHLHYELIVNGAKVDPMRVRLPTSRVLKGEELEAFQRERDRIDELLREDSPGALKVASG